MKIYISGPMTGRENLNRDAFSKAAAYLLAMGHEPVNPHDVGDSSLSWEENMKRDIKALVDCEGVYVLAGWETSRGAQVEIALAQQLGLSVVFEEEL